MGTLTVFDLTVFDPKSLLGMPVRFLTQQAVEDFLKQVIRTIDGTLDTDEMDFNAIREALKYVQVTVILSKTKIPLEDVL